jgi:hypothetical protein
MEHLKCVSFRKALVLPVNFRLGWKDLPGTNTLAYSKISLITAVNFFITLGPGAGAGAGSGEKTHLMVLKLGPRKVLGVVTPIRQSLSKIKVLPEKSRENLFPLQNKSN